MVPTRVTLNTSTLIDVIFSNDYQSHGETGVYETSVSDHYLIYTVYCKLNATKLGTHKVTKFRNYNKFQLKDNIQKCICDIHDWYCKNKLVVRRRNMFISNSTELDLHEYSTKI